MGEKTKVTITMEEYLRLKKIEALHHGYGIGEPPKLCKCKRKETKCRT